MWNGQSSSIHIRHLLRQDTQATEPTRLLQKSVGSGPLPLKEPHYTKSGQPVTGLNGPDLWASWRRAQHLRNVAEGVCARLSEAQDASERQEQHILSFA